MSQPVASGRAALPSPASAGFAEASLDRSLRSLVAPYAAPDDRRGVIQLVNTGLPFLVLMAAMLVGLHFGLWPAMLLSVPAAALLVRLFIIQHDCGHGSFFRSRRANDLLGRVIGVATLTPYTYWRRSHARHHATAGNLDRRGVGDIETLTLREYLSHSRFRRWLYRVYRHPLVLFGIGPAFQFLIRHRIPDGHPVRHRQGWLSVIGTNIAIAAVGVLVASTMGLGPLLLSYLPVILLAAAAGVWLFYVQHQFEDTYWESGTRWDYRAAALEGSSHYDLPRMLHWITGHIGLHHIHHLSSRIPNYRLRECYDQNPELRAAKRLTLADSIGCARLALWDEEARKLIPFRHAHQALRCAAAARSGYPGAEVVAG